MSRGFVHDLMTCFVADEYLDTEVTRRIIGALKREAMAVVEARQGAYNLLMSEEGPYSQLIKYDFFSRMYLLHCTAHIKCE